MDVYIMANLVQVLCRSIFLGKLSLPGSVCCVLSTLLGIVCPIIVSKLFVRKFRITQLLVLGVDKQKLFLYQGDYKGAVAKQCSEKNMHKTRNLFRAKTAQKGFRISVFALFICKLLSHFYIATAPRHSKVLPLCGEWQATEQVFRLKHINWCEEDVDTYSLCRK